MQGSIESGVGSFKSPTRSSFPFAASAVTSALDSRNASPEASGDPATLGFATRGSIVATSRSMRFRRMGHATASTTDRHIEAAESLDIDAIGMPFPPLPAAPGFRPLIGRQNAKTPDFHRGSVAARGQFARGNTMRPRSCSGRYIFYASTSRK